MLVGWTNLSLLSWFSNQEMNVVNESQQRLLSLPTQDHVKKDSIHIEALRLEFYLGFISLRTFVLYPVSQRSGRKTCHFVLNWVYFSSLILENNDWVRRNFPPARPSSTPTRTHSKSLIVIGSCRNSTQESSSLQQNNGQISWSCEASRWRVCYAGNIYLLLYQSHPPYSSF